MRRYFFYILHQDEDPIPDDEGVVFDGIEAARTEAAASLCDLMAEALRAGEKPSRLAIEIRDQAGAPLAVLTVPSWP